MDLSKLQNAFSTFNQHGGLFAIVDKKGQYILHPQDDVVDTRTIDPNTKDIRTGTIGSGDLVTLFGTKYFVQYREIERTGWYLLIYQNYKTSMTSIVASVITVIALMILVFFMMSRTFNRSFSKLEKNVLGYIAMTKKVIAGDYESVSMDQEFIEFDELSKSFSAMIHEVEVREEEILKYNAELEESQNELRSSNDEIFATLQQLMAIERELNQQNIYLDEQNIKLSNFIDGLNAGTWEWDITTGIILINERWGKMIGFQMDEIYPLTSEKFFECVHPEDLKRLNEDLKDTMDGKTQIGGAHV